MKNDTGKHYRREYNGIKLDPARICKIYEVGCILQSAIVKKTLCAGSRGHKDLLKDIDDIICAAERWKEMVIEDIPDFGRIDHTMIRTKDIDETINFYKTILGMKVLNVDDRLHTQGYKSAFIGYDESFKFEFTYNPSVLVDGGNKLDHIAVYVDDHCKVVQKLQANKIKFEVVDHSFGTKKYIFVKFKSPELLDVVAIEKGES